MNWFENARRRLREQWIRVRSRSFRNRAFDSVSIPAPAGFALLDSELRVIRADETLAAMVGISAREMGGQELDSLIPKMAPTVDPILHSVSRTGIPVLNFPIAGETPREPGVIRNWIASVFPICEWGFFGCIGVLVVEVTDHIQFGLLAEAERLANLGSWEVNLLTGEETWSPNLRQMLGLGTNHTRQPEDAFWALVHPEDREMVRTIIDGAMKFKHPYEYQTRVLLPNGRERTLFTRGKPVLNSSNCVIKRVGVTQDITERIEASRALIESEEKYRDLVENSHDLVCTHDLDGRVLWMNELPARILGYSASDLIGHRIPEMLDPETRNLFADYMERIRRDGHAEGLMQLVARSGERRIWEYRNTLRTEGVSEPIVRGMAFDITERQRAEEELQRAHVRTESILASVADVHILFDRDWHYVYVNEAAVRAIHLPREQILDRTFWEIYPDIIGTELERQSRRAMDDRVPVAFEFHYETRDTCWENRFYPAPEGLAVFATDISDRKRTHEALRKQEAVVRGLFETARTLTQTLELQDIFDLLNVQAVTLIGAESGCAGLWRESRFSCDSFFQAHVLQKVSISWPPGVGIPGWVLENKKTYLTNDADHDALILPVIRTLLEIRNVLCVPVFDIPHRDMIAFFALVNKPGGFEQSDVVAAEGIATVASIAIQNSLTHRRVSQGEDELRRLSSQLMTSQDDERRRIAEELHEHTAQDLAGLILGLGHLRRSVPDLPPPSRKLFDESIATVRRVFHETRNLSYKLHDSSLELAGLGVAIRSYTKTFSEHSGIDVRTEIPEDLGRLAPDEETTVYRIVQEALTNVHLHSGCKHATISIHQEGERVLLEIADSGVGMLREDDRNATAGVGIASMRERVKRHGGSMEIESAPGKGFRIRFQFATVSAATKHAARGAGDD